ncbi:pre-mRNA-processing factor 39-like, partial [Saccoglossus kowalevskii]|uniref:Pre-mRNA-processing factor 39-like n=1 Tax=Saccoglossus kowalevskii TaxID=10224 RepID=A0ABM0LV59_SACKO
MNEALKKDQGNPKLYLQLLDLEFQSNFQNEEAVLALFERILNNKNVSIDSKVLFSQRKLEYLEDFGSDVTKLLAAYEDHQKLIKQHGGKKRPHGGDG